MGASRCADEGDECGCNGHVYFGSKQSFCDDRKTFTSSENIGPIMDYWIDQTLMTTQETEIKTINEQATRAAKYEAEYASTVTIVTDIDFGEADATAASCQVCDRECSSDTEMTLTREIE